MKDPREMNKTELRAEVKSNRALLERCDAMFDTIRSASFYHMVMKARIYKLQLVIRKLL